MNVPTHLSGVYYTDFIAEMCRKRQVRRYLEIGVHTGKNLSKIPCDRAIGVDPCFEISNNVSSHKSSVHLYQTTSDRFFADVDVLSAAGGSIEFAFLDGMHAFEFLLRDFYNTEAICTASSLIAMHDCIPLSHEMADRNLVDGVPDGAFKGYWTGDVWKIVPILRKYRPDLTVISVDCPPTGIVLVTGLDPMSRILQKNYLEIVREFLAVKNDHESIQSLHEDGEIIRSHDILNGSDHTLMLRS
jgi:hypothetical protein